MAPISSIIMEIGGVILSVSKQGNDQDNQRGNVGKSPYHWQLKSTYIVYVFAQLKLKLNLIFYTEGKNKFVHVCIIRAHLSTRESRIRGHKGTVIVSRRKSWVFHYFIICRPL